MIGDTIRRIRLENGITLRQLADLAGVSDSYISLLERNVEEPSISVLKKLAQVLHCPIATFFEEDFPLPVLTSYGQREVHVLDSGALRWENLTGESADSSSVTMLRVTAAPGVTVHCNGMPEQACLCLESGRLLIRLPDTAYEMGPGDSLFLLPFIPFSARSEAGEAGCILSLSGRTLPSLTTERSSS